MDRDPNRTALREARRLQVLGDIPSVCAFCSYEGPVILDSKKWLRARGVPKRLLQDHHPEGRKQDSELTIPLCHNCHNECTEGLLREGVSMQRAKDKRERLARSLEADAAFFEDFAKAQRRKATIVRSLS
jgi:hypothetical protein